MQNIFPKQTSVKLIFSPENIFCRALSIPLALACLIVKRKEQQLVLLSQHMSQVAQQVRAYPGLCSMKQLGIFLLPPRWDADPLQGNTPNI